jgi:hypothetical protein
MWKLTKNAINIVDNQAIKKTKKLRGNFRRLDNQFKNRGIKA